MHRSDDPTPRSGVQTGDLSKRSLGGWLREVWPFAIVLAGAIAAGEGRVRALEVEVLRQGIHIAQVDTKQGELEASAKAAGEEHASSMREVRTELGRLTLAMERLCAAIRGRGCDR